MGHSQYCHSLRRTVKRLKVDSKGTQPCICMYPFTPKHPFHPGCHITLCYILMETQSSLCYIVVAAAAKSRQSCLTLCDPIDSSPPGSAIPRILQARTLEWVAISFSIAWKWKVKVKSPSRDRLVATPWTVAHQAPPSMGFSRQEYWSGLPYSSGDHTLKSGVWACLLCSSFSRLFWPFLIPCNSIWVLASHCQFLQRSHLGFWQGLYWLCRSIWGILPS